MEMEAAAESHVFSSSIGSDTAENPSIPAISNGSSDNCCPLEDEDSSVHIVECSLSNAKQQS